MPLDLARLAASVAITTSIILLPACAGGSDPPLGETALRGKALYQANCLSCHGGSSGGTIRDIPPKHNANGHTWHHADQLITDIVLNGARIPNYEWKMPAFKDKLTEADVKAIIEYLKTWWTKEQRDFQATVTAQHEP